MAKSKRKDEIVAAALDELGRKGLEGFSMASLARRVGLVPSGLYRHFSGKEEILDAVVASIGERLKGLAERVRVADKGALESLRSLLLAHVELIRTRSGIPRVMFAEVIFGAGGALRSQGRDVVEGYLEAVSGLIRDGQVHGEIRPELDPATLSVMFLGLIQPLAVLWELTDGAIDVTAQARRSWEVFCEAVQVRPPAGKPKRGRKRE